MIAALYVETGGAYYGLEDVDPWDIHRDARTYAGPWPVVAHPPCQRWGQLAPYVERRVGHLDPDRYRIGADNGTFQSALEAVRRFGGVLEHPAYSLAWPKYELPVPARGYWACSLFEPGWVTEVSQSAYGHPCRKRTWLYYVGAANPPALDWSEPPVTAQVSALWYQGRAEGLTLLDKNKSDPTPAAFRNVLLGLARSAVEVAA